MRRFVLVRDVDVTGVSGPGPVVWGLEFPDGRCAYRWNTPTATTTVADCVEDVEAIHGHDGATRVVWLDSEQGAELWRRVQEADTGRLGSLEGATVHTHGAREEIGLEELATRGRAAGQS